MFEYGTTLAASVNSDTQYIALELRQRNVAFLQELVGRYQYRLVRYLIYLLGRRDEVDDLVQETWLRVLERGSSYDGRSRFEPWLFTIARNLAIDHMRKRRIFSLDSNAEGEQDTALQMPASNAPSPFTLAARTEDAERLAGSLQLLEPIYREALVLRFQEELSLQEISGVVGAPVATVASRIYRGLRTLRSQLEGGKDEI
jgi:RNA polymerase sigma-70 factor (ECF subfamily)